MLTMPPIMPVLPGWPSSMMPAFPQQPQMPQFPTANYAPQAVSGYPGPITPQAMNALSGIVQLPTAPSGLESVAGIQLPFGKPPSTIPESLLSSQAKLSDNPHFSSSAYITNNLANRPAVERVPANAYGMK